MNMFTIELIPSEQRVLSSIKLDAKDIDGREDALANGEAAFELMESLLNRRAIPDQRLSYFLDPEFNIGGSGKSRSDVFERNGTRGEDIFRHPHFLNYLQYFLFGAQLPEVTMRDFSGKVTECGNVTSGDIAPLGEYAKRQTRSHRLNPKEAAEEFYKLALDCGLDQYVARAIRDAVKRIR